MKIQLEKKFDDISNIENLLKAWHEFVRGKRKKLDVQEFSLRLMDNIIELNEELVSKTYKHGNYVGFSISDPKPRKIHKASVRDRILHHAIYRILYPFFDKTFVADSFSCRLGKGTHRAINRFRKFAYKVSRNHTRTCWILKCDIKKFFESIDHEVLIKILESYIPDNDILWLLQEVIKSFSVIPSKGLPLGNLTSQLFCNIYMNEFDQFVKHTLKAKYYIRYADDFILFSYERHWLERQIPLIKNFLAEKLKLTLHPNKVFIKTIVSGVDFLGWVNFPDHRVLRTATKRRMMRRIKENHAPETLNSYIGFLSHGNSRKLEEKILDVYIL